MKFNIIFLSSLCILLFSCKKKNITYGDFEVYEGNAALLKINYVSSYTNEQKSIQLKLNGSRTGGIMAYRSPYPGGGYNTNGASSPEYLQLQAGAYDIALSVPFMQTSNDSIVLYNSNIKLEVGNNYTLHVTDTAAATKHVLTVDNTTKPDTGYSRYKFINLMPNVPMINLYYNDSLIAKDVKYMEYTSYFEMKVPPVISGAWAIRPSDSSSTSVPIATYISANTTAKQRVYTIFALGYNGQTTTSQKPYVSFFLER